MHCECDHGRYEPNPQQAGRKNIVASTHRQPGGGHLVRKIPLQIFSLITFVTGNTDWGATYQVCFPVNMGPHGGTKSGPIH